MTCTFCQIAKGELPAHVVHRDEDVVVFLDRSPLLHGHVLVIPARHVETLDDLPDDLLAPLLGAVRRTSAAVQKALRSEGSFVAISAISDSVSYFLRCQMSRVENNPSPLFRGTTCT